MQKENKLDTPNKVMDCLTLFSAKAIEIPLPDKFNYPFCYEPHPIAILAAEEVMQYIHDGLKSYHDFGIHDEGQGLGKMFGVLVVKDKEGNIGYLSAFSGKLEGGLFIPGFVPPVFDTVDERGFYRHGEEKINIISKKIQKLEGDSKYNDLCALLQKYKSESLEDIKAMKYDFDRLKTIRRQLRTQIEQHPDSASEGTHTRLNHESIRQHFIIKDRKKYWEKTIDGINEQLSTYSQKLIALRDQRKKMSAVLQQKLFDRYTFLSHNGEEKSLIDIFNIKEDKVPPSGAGECAAPKLLQYAYKNGLTPVTMAEFWWGKSPASDIKKHRYFYPACNSKCKPILGHMLQGLLVDNNPMSVSPIKHIDLSILYDDEYLMAINKPADLLSVPGKSERESVYDLIKQKYPQINGPIIVHRLDMSTSGIMLIAKSKVVHQHLQSQFIKHKIKKRYVAILDGILEKDEGSLDLPLRVDLDDRPRQMICHQHGKPAITHWQVIERIGNRTRVHFFPVTGRTHQLRVHASHTLGLNLPIVGDDLYGQRDRRLYLHAEQIEFIHPVTKIDVLIYVKADF